MYVSVIWDDEPGGNIEHIAEHGLTPEEVEEVLLDDRIETAYSRKTGNPCKFGHTSTGKYIIVIWQEVNDDPRMIAPDTAFAVPEPANNG
jgi:uncharacterized DUF497 family protein